MNRILLWLYVALMPILLVGQDFEINVYAPRNPNHYIDENGRVRDYGGGYVDQGGNAHEYITTNKRALKQARKLQKQLARERPNSHVTINATPSGNKSFQRRTPEEEFLNQWYRGEVVCYTQDEVKSLTYLAWDESSPVKLRIQAVKKLIKYRQSAALESIVRPNRPVKNPNNEAVREVAIDGINNIKFLDSVRKHDFSLRVRRAAYNRLEKLGANKHRQ